MKKSLIFTWYACNENCFFCSAEVDWRKHINKTTNRILTEILTEYRRWSKDIEFMWGEILIRSDINIILAFCKKIGFSRISIETNWTKFMDYNFTKKILQNWLNNIVLSIHWWEAKINDFHTQLRGSFDMKIKGLDNLYILSEEFDFSLSTNYVVTSQNINNINIFLGLIKDYTFIEKNIFAFVRPIKVYKENYKNYLPNFNSIKKVFETLKYDNKVLVQYLPYCIIEEKYHKKYLDYFSKWLKKNVNKINIEGNTSLEDAIQSEESYFNECTSCIYKDKCRGVWSEYVDFFKMKKPPLLIPIK